MRLITVLILVGLGLIQAKPYAYSGYKVYEIVSQNEEELNFVASLEIAFKLDFWSLPRLVNYPATVMIEPSKQEIVTKILSENQIKYSVLIENLETVFAKERESQLFNSFKRINGDISFDTYYRYNEINDYLDRLGENYPELVTVQEVGKSYEGRTLKTITISTGGGGTKPVIFIDAAIHAREWATPAFALYIIHQLVEKTENNLDLLNNIDWIILPVVNPDGYEYTHTDYRMWRKTRSITADPKCVGVDGNRNYDHFWMGQGGNDRICDETYSGPEAFSEPEARIVRDLLWENKDRIKLYISLHTYGNWLLYPWAYTKDLPDNVDLLEDLAKNVSDTVTAATGSKYKIGSTANVMYYAAGVSIDYAAGEVDIGLSYTWELPGGGRQGFDLPPEELQGVCEETFIGLKVFADYVATNTD